MDGLPSHSGYFGDYPGERRDRRVLSQGSFYTYLGIVGGLRVAAISSLRLVWGLARTFGGEMSALLITSIHTVICEHN